MPGDKDAARQQCLAYNVLTDTFLAFFAAFNPLTRRKGKSVQVQ